MVLTCYNTVVRYVFLVFYIRSSALTPQDDGCPQNVTMPNAGAPLGHFELDFALFNLAPDRHRCETKNTVSKQVCANVIFLTF